MKKNKEYLQIEETTKRFPAHWMKYQEIADKLGTTAQTVCTVDKQAVEKIIYGLKHKLSCTYMQAILYWCEFVGQSNPDVCYRSLSKEFKEIVKKDYELNS